VGAVVVIVSVIWPPGRYGQCSSKGPGLEYG
jgi:hypothetical protein